MIKEIMETTPIIPTISLKCPKCGAEITEMAYFCSNCGKVLRARPELTDIWHQLWVYLFSFFLSPLGLYYVRKYLRQPDPKSKIVGLISLLLTIAAIGVVLWTGMQYLETAYAPLKELNSF